MKGQVGMSSKLVDVQITHAGRPVGLYQEINANILKLREILYPEIPAPYDWGVLPKTLTSEGENIPVLVLGEVSNPPNTVVSTRLLGGISNNGSGFWVLAVLEAERSFSQVSEIESLPAEIRTHIRNYLGKSELEWLSIEAVEQTIKQAYLRYRKIKYEAANQTGNLPAWMPVEKIQRPASYLDLEHYTPAEYTFFQLPPQIQFYVNQHLSNDERILFSMRCSSIPTQGMRAWFSRNRSHEGVLILTSQQLLYLEELTPLGDSGVKYGYRATVGMLERLRQVKIEQVDERQLLFKTSWIAQRGTEQKELVFPLYTGSDLRFLAGLLEKFSPEKANPLGLRRATLPPDSDQLPLLSDPSANRDEEMAPINEGFRALLQDFLSTTETAYAWALIPAWFENRNYSSVLLVTNDRLRVISDPKINSYKTVEVNLKDISTLEFTLSILNSTMTLNTVGKKGEARVNLNFPYTAGSAFRKCFDSIRQLSALIPLT